MNMGYNTEYLDLLASRNSLSGFVIMSLWLIMFIIIVLIPYWRGRLAATITAKT